MSRTFVSDSTCTTCGSGTKLTTGSSTSYAAAGGTTAADVTVQAGKTAYGYLSTDRVCLDLAATTCTADTFEFFLALSQTDLYTNDGLVGLAPYTGTDGQAPLLISALPITEPVFAFLFTDDSNILDIGAVQNDSMLDPTDLVYLTSTAGNAYWSSEITQVRTRNPYGNVSKHYSFTAIEAMLTINQECIGMPDRVFN